MASSTKRVSEIDDQVPTKKSFKSLNGDKLENFLRWCTENKFVPSSKIRVEREHVCAQYGMVATQNISEGEVLFCIPRKMLLSADTCSIAQLLREGKEELQCEGGWVPLLLALLYEYNNPQSPWRPYLDLIPDFSELDLPMFWSSVEREKMLAGTGVVESVERDLQLMEKDFATIALPFMQKNHEVFSSACQSFDLYKKMVAFVMAYSFTEPPGSAMRAEKKQDAIEEEEEDENTMPMMVPLADILNHIAKNNARLMFDVDALRMVSTQDIEEGKEIFNTYGELANSHLLHMYGFAECFPENHFDTVDLPLSVVSKVGEELGGDPELTAAKLLFLQEQDLLQEGGAFVLGMEGVLTDDELLAVIKVLAMSAEEFAEHVQKEGWSDAESDILEDSSLTFEKIPSLKETWRKILARCGEMCLALIAGEEQEDATTMADQINQLSTRERYSLYVRYGQRQLLRQLVDACK